MLSWFRKIFYVKNFTDYVYLHNFESYNQQKSRSGLGPVRSNHDPKGNTVRQR